MARSQNRSIWSDSNVDITHATATATAQSETNSKNLQKFSTNHLKFNRRVPSKRKEKSASQKPFKNRSPLLIIILYYHRGAPQCIYFPYPSTHLYVYFYLYLLLDNSLDDNHSKWSKRRRKKIYTHFISSIFYIIAMLLTQFQWHWHHPRHTQTLNFQYIYFHFRYIFIHASDGTETRSTFTRIFEKWFGKCLPVWVNYFMGTKNVYQSNSQSAIMGVIVYFIRLVWWMLKLNGNDKTSRAPKEII